VSPAAPAPRTGAPGQARPAFVALLATLLLAVLVEGALALFAALGGGAARWVAAVRPGLLYAGLGAAVYAAARLRREGSGWRRGRAEAVAAARTVGGIALGICLADQVLRALLPDGLLPGTADSAIDAAVQSVLLAVFGAVLSTLLYLPTRALLLAWRAWGRLRRRRVLWSLTHGQLSVTLVVAAALAVFATFLDYHHRAALAVPASKGDAGAALGEVIDRLAVAAGSLLSTSAVLVLGIVVPATLISVVVLRQATRRLEHLTTATAALRAGDLTARVPVSGEDEVARLQGDFNAMAADLEGAMHDLRAERDTVARLLQDRRELVVAVSHELRTPVATLRAYLDSSLDRPPDAPDAPPLPLRQDLEVMAREAVRLQRLIEDLFVLSRAEAGRLSLTLEAVDTGPLLQRCAAAAAPLAWERGRVDVIAQPPPRPLWASADPGRLEQVVRNLLANAVRHTPPGGLVLLTAAPSPPGPGAPAGVVLQVKDTGEGIPAADLPRVWERFYRGPPSPSREGDAGAGLGLALVKELTEAMGGTVTVESAPGAGSVFAVRLTAAPGPGAPEPTASGAATPEPAAPGAAPRA
jgi:signal transduction histidine kinase